GDTVEIPITLDILDPDGPPWDSLGAFDLRLQYEDTIISFLDARVGETVSSWYMVRASATDYHPRPGYSQLRLQGSRILQHGSTTESTQLRPDGVLFYLHFEIASSLRLPDDSTAISFYSRICNDNILVQSWTDLEYYIQFHDAADPSFTPLYDTMRCERRYHLSPVIEFVSGEVIIDMLYGPDRADLNLNGVPFEFADAMMFADYLDRGLPALSRDPEIQQRQIQAGDIDGDGEPLTQTDYEEMIRIGGAPFTIRMGDATMRAGDTIALPLTLTFLDKNHSWDDHFGGFDLLLSHNIDHLEFLQAEQGSAIAEWEYFTYRTGLFPGSECVDCGAARVLAIRDMNDGIPADPVTEFQEGIFANLLYTTTSATIAESITTPVAFYFTKCTDNVLVCLRGHTVFTPIDSASDIVYDPGYDTTGCRLYRYGSVLSVTRCVAGTVTIEE
ncbi:MAG TPA: hypothetical protein VM118_11985, partial [Acidobacteriota bacterium]|nr:hypothetical protein [Acidobacteriota bacterium]